MHCNTMEYPATHCSTMQHTAKHCCILQHTVAHYSALQHTSRHCNTLRHTATHCNTLQHPTTHCNTLRVEEEVAVCKGGLVVSAGRMGQAFHKNMCAMTHECVYHDSCVCAVVRHDSSTRECMRGRAGVSRIQVCHDSFMCVP